MKKRNVAILVLFLVGLLLSGLIRTTLLPQTEQYKVQEANHSQDPLLHEVDLIRPFASKYIGDMSNFSNLLRNLPMSELLDGCSLDLETLTVTVRYQIPEKGISQEYLKRVMAYNAVASFCLIDNLEGVCIRLAKEEYLFERSTMESMFGGSLKLLLNNWEDGFRNQLKNQEYVDSLLNQASVTSVEELYADDEKTDKTQIK